MSRNIQAKKPISTLSEDRLRELTNTALALMRDGIIIADMNELDTPLVWVNANFVTITGYNLAEAVGKNCRYLQGNDHMQPEIGALRDAIRDGKAAKVTLRNYRKDGTLLERINDQPAQRPGWQHQPLCRTDARCNGGQGKCRPAHPRSEY